MNYHELLKKAGQDLIAAGKEERDARQLLLYLKKWSVADYLKYGVAEVAKEEEICYQELLKKRTQGVPVQEITGSQNFYGYEITVSPDVLTPRPETEQLVELALREMESLQWPKVLDLCTGSGCIAIAIAAENKKAQVTAIDISDQALQLAEKNGEQNLVNDRITWLKSDLFEGLEERGFDIIISNPPYIPTNEIADLEIEVKQYDPQLALDGGVDGLYFYRKIAEAGINFLKPGGKLFLEIGDGQGSDIAGILRSSHWQDVQVLPDYAGRQRMVVAGKPGHEKIERN